jgi:hypothetical protein
VVVWLALSPHPALAQTGSISGIVRDASGLALPGVTVEVSGPQAIAPRVTTTDSNGRYQITSLPVGTYRVRFSLEGFNVSTRENVQLTTDFTANVNADLKVGNLQQTIEVVAEAPVVDVANARQQQSFAGEELRDLPTARTVPSLMALVPGVSSSGYLGNICNGGVGVFCSPIINNFNAHTSINDSDGLDQGRLLVNGIPINAGNPNLISGISSGYNADIANAQEISFQLSGALGESETGGMSINIIPRTGGNRYAGNFFTSYTSLEWFDRNNGTRTGAQPNLLLNDHDVNGGFGGPILRDRLWFYAVGRHQGKESSQTGGPFYYNLNAGKFAANYEPDIARGPVTYKNVWRNINARLTFQATQKNKFDIFWDEQDTCQDPCDGVVSVYTSPESWWSVQTRPNHLAQLTWTNPLTSRLLLEAGVSGVMQHYDTSRHRYLDNPMELPRVSECQTDASKRVNTFAGWCPFWALTSGSILNGQQRDLDSWRPRVSASYITGSHNAKIGYDGSYFSEDNYNDVNGMRLAYSYNTNQVTNCSFFVTTNCIPTSGGVPQYSAGDYCSNSIPGRTATVTANGITQPNPFPCGNMALYHPEDLYNTELRPSPVSFTMYTGPRTISNRVQAHALYVQDQWTLNRFTLSGALRYDQASSKFLPTCLEPDAFVSAGYCAPREETDGVSFKNLTPRWGVAWDVFGTGKTSLKWNMGKYLQAAQIGGIYTAANPASRTLNSIGRGWQDWNGNRLPDCYGPNSTGVPDLPIGSRTNGGTTQAAGTPNWARPHTDLGDYCGATTGGADSALRFAQDPYVLEQSGLNAGFFTTTQCGRESEPGVSPDVEAYCQASGQNLLSGWDKRRSEWQLGIGIQHELLPRLSAEVTYNRRWYGNQQVTDTLNDGCDLYGAGIQDPDACLANNLNFINPTYDFFSFTAPTDPRLPNGGGYLVVGNTDEKPGVETGSVNAVTLTTRQKQVWRGVDTNFVLRARGGLRLSGGTSTGSQYTDNCEIEVDNPNVRSAHGGDPSCRIDRPFQTNVRANASYTIPWVDLLTSVVFQYRPGVELSANYTVFTNELTWVDPSRAANTSGCASGVNSAGCFTTGSATQRTINLLNAGEAYGEGVRLVDLKFAKNVRFAGKRLNVGVDIYNLFNSDAILAYNNSYNSVSGGVATVNPNFWTASQLVSPRFARFQVQFDF